MKIGGTKGKKFSVGGLERGSSGALGNWDVVGKSLDKANPFASTDDGRDEDAQAAALAEAASHGFDGIATPNQGPINYEHEDWLGDYKPTAEVTAGEGTKYRDVDPRLAKLSQVNGTAYDDVNVDPRLEDAQMASLNSLDDIISGGGRSAKEEADLQHTLSDVAAQDRGRRDAILQNAQARGMGGSGMELLAQLQSSQAATDRASQAGLDINADAEQRGLEAIMNRGSLAGSVRGQDYGEQASRAQAHDVINQFNIGAANSNAQFNSNAANNMGQFNASNQMQNDQYNKSMQYDANKANVGYANDASKYNHAGQQTVANENVGIANTNKNANIGIGQQNFQNDVDLAGAKTGAQKGYADYVGGVADRKAKTNAGQKGGIIGAGGSIIGAMVSDERSKKDVQDVDPAEIEEFLSALAPKRFRYKDSKNGNGNRVGDMAQNLERTSIGRDIVSEDETGEKSVDTNNLLGAIVASLAHLNKKVK